MSLSLYLSIKLIFSIGFLLHSTFETAAKASLSLVPFRALRAPLKV